MSEGPPLRLGRAWTAITRVRAPRRRRRALALASIMAGSSPTLEKIRGGGQGAPRTDRRLRVGRPVLPSQTMGSMNSVATPGLHRLGESGPVRVRDGAVVVLDDARRRPAAFGPSVL